MSLDIFAKITLVTLYKKKNKENHKNNIILVGFMGCGKTTIGHLLAQILGKTYVDTDKLIEDQVGMSISRIFELKGEPYFRKLEKEAISTLDKLDNNIISVGGGMPCHDDNMHILNKLGTTIYIKVSKPSLAKRLYNDTTRPIIQGHDSLKSLEKSISNKLRERKSYYEQADFTILGNSLPEKLAKRIIKKIRMGSNIKIS